MAATIDSLIMSDEQDNLLTYLTPPTSPPQCSPVSSLFADLDTPLSNSTFLFTQDDMTFDKLSAALSRALTPPPESFTPPMSKQHAVHTTPTPGANPNFHPNCQTCMQESARVLSSPSLHSPSDSSADYSQFEDPLLSAFGSDLSSSPDLFSSSSVDGLFDTTPSPTRSELSAPLPSQYSAYTVPKRPQSAICKPKASKMRPASSIAMKPKQALSTSAKRESHNLSERHRRLAMKESFDSLRKLIPEIAANDRVHTGQILKAAIDFVHAMQREEAELCREKELLQEEIRRKTAAAHH
jgi:hypothetical protein